MNTVSPIKELLSTLKREHELLTEMLEKRKSLFYKYDFALELVDFDEERIQYLINHSVIRQNGPYIEIDDQFLQFFEMVLEVNEEINISYINEPEGESFSPIPEGGNKKTRLLSGFMDHIASL